MISYSTVPNVWNTTKFIQNDGRNMQNLYIRTRECQTMTAMEFINLSLERKYQISLLRFSTSNTLSVLDLTGFINLNVIDIQAANVIEIRGVSTLVNLNVILAEDNFLTNIDEFVDLPRLQWLDCPSNRIPSIKEFPQQTQICYVDFRNNPFIKKIGLPPESYVLSCGKPWFREVYIYNEWREIRDYIEAAAY